MKRLGPSLLLFGLSLGCSSDPALSQEFQAANNKALAGEHAAATSIYESLLARGIENADLYYNLAGSAYQSGDVGHAVLYYRRALRIEPHAEDTAANLATIQAGIYPNQAPTASDRPLSLEDLLEPIVMQLPRALFPGLLLIFNAAFFVCLGVWLRDANPATRPKWRLYALVTLGLVLFSAGITGAEVYVANHPKAVLMKPSALREGPNPRFPESQRLPVGATLRVLETDGAWVKVQEVDGTVGWMLAVRLEDV